MHSLLANISLLKYALLLNKQSVQDGDTYSIILTNKMINKIEEAIADVESIEIDHGSNKVSAANTANAIDKVLKILKGKSD